jgi:fibronectin type 3 domain-containing protein
MRTSLPRAILLCSSVALISALVGCPQPGSSENAPATPSGLAVGNITASSLTVSWTAANGATGYELFRATDSTGQFTNRVYKGSDTSFTDTHLSPSTTYFYEVEATNPSGSSSPSAPVSATTAASTGGSPPSTPAGLTVGGATALSLAVSWTAASGATSYQVYRDTSSTGSFSTEVYNNSSTNFTDGSLSASTTYYYRVQATNNAGSSAFSAPASGTTTSAAPGVPSTPAGLTVGGATASSLAVSWTAASGATSYQVYRDTSSTGSFSTEVYNNSSTNFTDGSLSASTTYYYKVQATNNAGSSAFSAPASGTTTSAAPSVPSTPTGIQVGTITSSSITLSWNTVSGANSYQVYTAASSSGPFTTLAYSGPSAQPTIGGLQQGTQYWYEVQATNSMGSSALSSAFGATTMLPAPSSVTVASGSPSYSSLVISWTAVTNASNYLLYQSSSPGGSFALIRNAPAPLTSFTASGLQSSTTYYYEVQAQNSAATSATSPIASGSTTFGPPPAPTVTVTCPAYEGQLTISWNNESTAASYIIFRSTSASGGFVALGTVLPGSYSTIQYTDTGLSPGTTYYYEVQASNSVGTGPMSAVASSITLPATPTGLSVTVANPAYSSLKISWNSVNGASGYVVYGGPSGGGLSGLYSGSSTSFTQSNLVPGTSYSYEVIAYNSSGYSPATSVISGTTATAGTLYVSVYKQNGQAMPSAVVRLYSSNWGSPTYSATANGSGVATFSNIPAGNYSAMAFSGSYANNLASQSAAKGWPGELWSIFGNTAGADVQTNIIVYNNSSVGYNMVRREPYVSNVVPNYASLFSNGSFSVTIVGDVSCTRTVMVIMDILDAAGMQQASLVQVTVSAGATVTVTVPSPYPIYQGAGDYYIMQELDTDITAAPFNNQWITTDSWGQVAIP